MTLVGKKRIGQEQGGQGKTRQVKEWADSTRRKRSSQHESISTWWRKESVLIGIVRILFGAWSLACLLGVEKDMDMDMGEGDDDYGSYGHYRYPAGMARTGR